MLYESIQWKNIIGHHKNEKSNRLWTYSSPTLHFLGQFWGSLFHHFWDLVLRFRINFKTCFMMLGRLPESPDMIWDDREQNLETSFFHHFWSYFGGENANLCGYITASKIHSFWCLRGQTKLKQHILTWKNYPSSNDHVDIPQLRFFGPPLFKMSQFFKLLN